MTSKKKHGKKRLIIAATIAAIISTVAGAITFNAKTNLKNINANIDNGLSILSEYYTVTPCDKTDYTDMTMKGIMKFHTDQYHINELGNLSVMTANMGFMQMVSFMITPFEKQAPLCTLDFMYIAGNRKSYVEFYDLVPDTTTPQYVTLMTKLREMQVNYNNIEELPSKECWYDNYLNIVMHKQLKDDEINNQLFSDALRAYVEATKDLNMNTEEEAAAQLAITESYSNGLIENGGVSTDFFKKSLGADTTRDFFNKVFFGTDDYRKEVTR